MRLWRADFIWLLLAILVLLLGVWWIPGLGSIDTDTYSVSHTGKKVFYQSVRRLNENVYRSTTDLIPRSDSWDRIVILGSARNPTEEEWDDLYDEVFDGGVLLFAPRFHSGEVDTGPFGARIVPLHDESKEEIGDKIKELITESDSPDKKPDETSTEPPVDHPVEKQDSETPSPTSPADETWGKRVTNDFIADTSLVNGKLSWKTNAFLELNAPQWEVLLSADDKPQVARRTLGDGVIVLLASDEIFTNGAMIDPQRALLAYRILETATDPGVTWFDETLNNSGTPKVLGILFDPVFRPITLQLALIAVLFGWSGSRRFGPVEQRTDSRRRSVVEHAQALGILYFRAGAGSHAVRCLHEFLKVELRRLYGATFRVDNADAIARLTNDKESDIRELFNQSKTAESGKISTTNSTRLLKRYSALINSIRAGRNSTRNSINH